MKHSISHDLDPGTLKRAIDAALRSYAAELSKYSPTIDWVSDEQVGIGFSVKGLSLAGQIQLKPKTIDLNLDVPFILRPFKKKAIAIIEREIGVWIDRARREEL
jgi:hypothetical protein